MTEPTPQSANWWDNLPPVAEYHGGPDPDPTQGDHEHHDPDPGPETVTVTAIKRLEVNGE